MGRQYEWCIYWSHSVFNFLRNTLVVLSGHIRLFSSSRCLVVGLRCVVLIIPGHVRLYIDITAHLYTYTMCFGRSIIETVLPVKSDSDVMFCLQSYQGLRIDRSLDVY